MKVQLANVRIAFAALFAPKPGRPRDDGTLGEPKFGGQLIIDPKVHTREIAALNDALAKVADAKWGAKGPAILVELKKKGRVCYYTEPYTNDQGEVREGFEDMHRVSVSSSKRPLVLDRDKSVLTQADGRPYSGCYVNASIELWPQDNANGKRINAEIKGVQFVRDGDAFSGGTPASPDDFADLGVDAQPEVALV